MKKIYILSGLMCLLPGLSFGENPRIAELTRSKQEKMERLQKCEGTTKALKIAGLSTIGLTAVGVVGNVVEAQKLQTYQGQSNALDTQITQTKKEIEDKKAEIEKKKAAAAAAPGPSATPPAATNLTETSTTSTTPTTTTTSTTPTTTATNTTTPTTTGLAAVDTSVDGISAKAYNKKGSCDRYEKGIFIYDFAKPAQTCSELGIGQWKVDFSYGRVSGNSKCSSTNGEDAEAGNPASSDGPYCWCKVKYYTPSGKKRQNVESLSSWVFFYSYADLSAHSADYCAYNCARSCASSIMLDAPKFRAAAFAGTSN